MNGGARTFRLGERVNCASNTDLLLGTGSLNGMNTTTSQDFMPTPIGDT